MDRCSTGDEYRVEDFQGRTIANSVIAVVGLTLILGTAPGKAASVDQAGGRCLTAQWIDEVKAFVAEVTSSSLPEVCIRTASQNRLNLAVASAVYRAAEDAASAFIPGTAEIILAEDLDFSDPVARSYLVHELVHAQQYARGNADRAQCVGLLEGEAYSLQARYLRRHRLKDDAFLFQLIGMLQSSCGIDY